MCGRQHARTLRPEALWRHKYNLKERLSNLGNEKHSTIKSRSNKAIIDELTKACDQNDGRKSNALRMRNLSIVLEALIGSFSLLSDNILAQYTKFLSADCPKIKSPSTVLTHFSKIKL